MRTLFHSMLLMVAVFSSAVADAADITAFIRLTGTVSGTLEFRFTELPGTAVTGLTTETASFNAGKFAYLGPTGGVYSLPFKIGVVKHNVNSPSYGLFGSIETLPPSGITWKINGVPLSTAGVRLTTATAYGETSHTFDVVIASTAPAVPVTNTAIWLYTVAN